MPAALSVAALYTGFVALSGFLFGQIFFGHFSFVASVAGVAGLVASAGAFLLAKHANPAPTWVMWSSFVALLGVAADAANYYINLAIPGNYYAWALIGPYVACLCFIGGTARNRAARTPSEA